MLPLLFLALAAPNDPTIESAVLNQTAQWSALAACPRVVTLTGNTATATGVAIGIRDGYVYVLTAYHAVVSEREQGVTEREVQFFTKESYPEPAKSFRGVEVVAKWYEPDLALLKVTVGADILPTLPLAGVDQRPKRFPFSAISVGCSKGAPPTFREERVIAKRTATRSRAKDGKDTETVAFFWELSATPVQGRSGGPLLDAQGRVIGICAASRENRGYYTHLDELLASLKEDGYGWLWTSDR